MLLPYRVMDPRQGQKANGREHELDRVPAQLDPRGRVPQCVVELVSLVADLGDPDVRLGGMKCRDAPTLRGAF
jgi:hypothetical protein